MRPKHPFLVIVPTLAALAATALAIAAPGQGGQILRSSQEEPSGILTEDRVARLSLALPVEPEVAWDAWTNAPELVEWLAGPAAHREVGRPLGRDDGRAGR